MKEVSENQLVMALILSATVLLLVIVVAVAINTNRLNQHRYENNYCERQMQGSQDTFWEKCWEGER